MPHFMYISQIKLLWKTEDSLNLINDYLFSDMCTDFFNFSITSLGHVSSLNNINSNNKL